MIEKEGRISILAEKGILGRFGSLITHISIIIILVGAVIGSIGGFKENVSILEGETLQVPHADFSLRLDAFELEYYKDSTRPKDYKSTLAVVENNKDVLTKTIEVNDPLSYKGIFFYQSTYGQSVDTVDQQRVDNQTRSHHPAPLYRPATLLG